MQAWGRAASRRLAATRMASGTYVPPVRPLDTPTPQVRLLVRGSLKSEVDGDDGILFAGPSRIPDSRAPRHSPRAPSSHDHADSPMWRAAYDTLHPEDTPNTAYLRARLRAALRRMPNDMSITSYRTLLDVTHPLLRSENSSLLDSYLVKIADSLCRPPTNQPLLPWQQAHAAEVLGYCWSRQTALHRAEGGDEMRVMATAKAFGDYLLGQAVARSSEPARFERLLHVLEETLANFGRAIPGARLPTPITAAWIVLRAKNYISTPVNTSLTFPALSVIVSHLEIMGFSGSRWTKAARTFVSSQDGQIPLPTSLEGLEGTITSLRAREDDQGVFSLWNRYEHLLRHPDEVPESNPILHPDMRGEMLARFIRSMLRPSRKRASAPGTDSDLIQNILSFAPRPIPRPIHRVFLAYRAKSIDYIDQQQSVGSDSSEMISIDESATVLPEERRGNTLANLKATWKATRADGGVRDVAMYMIYFAGLGRLSDVEGLQEAWNELVQDNDAKQLYIENSGPRQSTQWPSTGALNVVLSAALNVPKIGGPVGLGLFEQCIQPGSAIKVDIVTINTVLRHHARQRDIEAMNRLITLALQKGLSPDIVTFTTLVQGMLKAGRLDLAKQILNSMNERGVKPNERMCSMLIADLAKNGDKVGLERAEELLAEMRRNKMDTGSVTWTALIAGYFRGGWETDGWDAVARMERTGVKMNRITYNIILKQAHDKELEAKQTMPKGGWRRGEESLAYKIYQRMVADGVQPNSDTYIIVLGPLIKAQKWWEADEIVRDMQAREFNAESGVLRGLLRRVRLRRHKAALPLGS